MNETLKLTLTNPDVSLMRFLSELSAFCYANDLELKGIRPLTERRREQINKLQIRRVPKDWGQDLDFIATSSSYIKLYKLNHKTKPND